MGKGILFYGSDITGSSHLWMRRQFEWLKPNVKTLIEYKKPANDIDISSSIVLLPQRKQVSSKVFQLLSDIYTDIRQRQIIRTESKSGAIDIIIVHFLFNAVPHRTVWNSLKKPVYVHCHGLDVTWEKTGAQRKWRKLWWGDYVEEVLKLPENVIFVANSEITKKRLTNIGIAVERVKVVSPGVPVPNALPEKGRKNGPLNILFIGRLVDVKGPVELLKAFDLACSKGLNGHLTVAGDGPLFQECEKIVQNSDYREQINLCGAVSMEEGEQLRKNADIFTAHSCKGKDSKQEESFGVAFVEAMAAGLPVVTGRSGSLSTIIRHKVDGFLFEPGNIHEHADYLLMLQNKSEMRIIMGKSAYDRAKNNFSIEKEREELTKLYELHE